MKIRSIILFSSLLALIPVVQAADWVAQEYPIKNVSQVVVGGEATIELTQGDTEYLRAEADPEIMKRVKVDLSNGVLTLGVKAKEGGIFGWFNQGNAPVRFVLRVKQLSNLDLSGAARANVGDLTQDQFTLIGSGASAADFATLNVAMWDVTLSGASNIKVMKVTSQFHKVEISGASNLIIDQPSAVSQIEVELSGASNLRAKNLKATTANIEASGASHAELAVSENLIADASGASSIDYFGSPKAQTESSGAGHVNAHAAE